MHKSRKNCFESLESRTLLSLTPLGGEFQVNTTTSGDQYAPAVASDAAGDYVIVWTGSDNDRVGSDIYAQRYAANGSALGSEFRVNTITAGLQNQPDVTMDDAGNFTIVWTSENVAGGSGRDVVFRSYSADGNARAPSETIVNQTVTGSQESPSVASDAYGFTVAWDGDSGDGNSYDIFARSFTAGGAPIGDEMRMNTVTGGPQTDPSIDMNSTGDYVIAWDSAPSTSSTDYDIYQRRYRYATLQAPILVSDNASTDYQITPSAAIDAFGDVVVVWQSHGADGSGYGVELRRYDSNASASPIFQVNTFTTGAQAHPVVDASAMGGFTVAWDSAGQDGFGLGVYRQSYNFDGTKLGGETRVSTTTANDQTLPAISLNTSGDAIIVWQDGSTAINGNGADGSGYGVFAQRYGEPPTVTYGNFNYLTGQSISIDFSEDVSGSLSPADFAVRNLTTGTTVPSSEITYSYSFADNATTVMFAHTLANGNYTLTLASTAISDASGTALDGDGDGVPGGDYSLSFFVLVGDANHDRKVDVLDLGILSSHWQQSGQTFATGDFNGDGVVDVVDLGILSSNWQVSLAAPAVATKQVVAVSVVTPVAKKKVST